MQVWLLSPLHLQLVSLSFGCSGYYDEAFSLFGGAIEWPGLVLAIRKSRQGQPSLAPRCC